VYRKALTAAGMGDDNAAALAELRISEGNEHPEPDVLSLNAGIPGPVLLAWAQAKVPMLFPAHVLEQGGRLADVLELTPTQAATHLWLAPEAAWADVRIRDIADISDSGACANHSALQILRAGFTPVDVTAARGAGVDFQRPGRDETRSLWDMPDRDWAATTSPEQRVLALAIVNERSTTAETAIAVAVGLNAAEADVATRFILDGQPLISAVQAAKAVSREPQARHLASPRGGRRGDDTPTHEQA
jgi:hypothetical protein